MHLSYLPRAQAAGARILSRCRADRVVIENGRAVGVSAMVLDSDGDSVGALQVDCDAVLVAAGAIGTPLLLKASDAPDPSGMTGGNLRVHPATGVAGVFDEDDAFWKGTLQSYFIDEFMLSHGIMLEATTTVPGIGAASFPGSGATTMTALRESRTMATLGFLIADTSAGRVRRLRDGSPLITYRLNALDKRRLGMGLAFAAEILLAAGAERVEVGMPGADTVDDARQLTELRRGDGVARSRLKLSAFHPMGTARMGGDRASSVLDPWGRHHQVENLWIADASVFPTCVGVNPQLGIMAMARRTAQVLATG
jgi:hypothetical protein